ncbi:hypothetical protein E2C01_042981 [Portunus trituberculatus]|uniref:Uncharacterized protein n=1 Tax=Portunus trituberculatus TaxID=210409 RepID=A0A5B7FUG3_PORTR|nr:hypothetical protein [Portunus trituberculatus]
MSKLVFLCLAVPAITPNCVPRADVLLCAPDPDNEADAASQSRQPRQKLKNLALSGINMLNMNMIIALATSPK